MRTTDREPGTLSFAVTIAVVLLMVWAGRGRAGPALAATSIALSPAAHPQDLFNQLRALNDAAIRGDLPALRAAAGRLAAEGTVRLPGERASLPDESLKQAATRAVAAADNPQAATAVAEVILSCGACHGAAGVTPTLPAIDMARQTNIVGHMRRHARAADEMMRGMIVPSDRLWLQGAMAFAESPLRAGDFPVDFQRGATMAQLDADIHRLAQNAFVADTPRARGRTYGQLLATCTACHGQHERP